mmetsp:Transcript_39226/g.62837  ORF Transcript_39226/g.62837 Transcript_39226/m.62837 type:complete len:206 (-) Transcript_39226:208-825(-)
MLPLSPPPRSSKTRRRANETTRAALFNWKFWASEPSGKCSAAWNSARIMSLLTPSSVVLILPSTSVTQLSAGCAETSSLNISISQRTVCGISGLFSRVRGGGLRESGDVVDDDADEESGCGKRCCRLSSSAAVCGTLLVASAPTGSDVSFVLVDGTLDDDDDEDDVRRFFGVVRARRAPSICTCRVRFLETPALSPSSCGCFGLR